MSLIHIHEFHNPSRVAKATTSLVSKVTHSTTQKIYALKRITRDDYIRHVSDLMELMITKQCGSHPNIIKIHGFSVETMKINGVYHYITYILMELWERSFNDEILLRKAQEQFFAKSKIVNILQTLISTFVYLQKLEIAHRDIKPENILTNSKGEICVIDFSEGININEAKREATTLVGSPYYMSPELKECFLNGSYSPIDAYNPWKSDVFSLGMTMIDISSLTIGDDKSLVDKMSIIKEIYGENILRIFLTMIEKDPIKRMNFIELENSINFKELVEEKENHMENQGKEETKMSSKKHEIMMLKKKMYGVFENLIHEPKIKEVKKNFVIFFKKI